MRLRSEKLTGEFEGKYVFFMHSVEDAAYPIKKDVIRIHMFTGMMFWADGNDCRAIQFNTLNMGGYFPMKLMNMAMGAMMKKGMEKEYNDLLQI